MPLKTEYGSFTIERTLASPVEKVYKAFAEKSLKEKWFGASESYELDFQVGGKEVNIAVPHEGTTFRYLATYYDIVPEKRIIYSYEMYNNEQRISVSLATVEFIENDGKTTLKLREDGVFLDGSDSSNSRENGTHYLLGLLEESLSK